jgi:hypothetical protein
MPFVMVLVYCSHQHSANRAPVNMNGYVKLDGPLFKFNLS